jgi:hypothetical protein
VAARSDQAVHLRKVVTGEVDPAQRQPDKQHDQVTDRGIHNLAERTADDHANSQIDHNTFERERAEFTDERYRSLPALERYSHLLFPPRSQPGG